jgi:hypothetical protein
MAHRLDQVEDFARLEIESAMAKGMPVIPVLVENANMRSVGESPDGMPQFATAMRARYCRDPTFTPAWIC